MDNAKISAFYNKIFSDPVLKSELTETAKKIKNKEDLKKFIKTEIIPLARENGFSFSEEDLVDYESEALKKLKAEDLYNVSGGASFKTFLMSGGILSALFLSAGLTSGQIADAFIDLKDVKESGAAMERAIRNSVQQNAQAQANNQQNGVQTQGNDDDDNDNNNSNEPIDNDKYSYNVDLWAFAKVARDIINGSPSFNENDFLQKNDVDYNYNDNNNHNISDNAEFNNNDNNDSNNAGNGANVLNNNGNNNEISVTLPKNVIKNSIYGNLLEIAQYFNIDITVLIYILEACNLFVPFIDCNYSGFMDKLKFENGDTEGIIAGDQGAVGGDGVPILAFNKYSGAGITNFTNMLFPSSGGTLNAAGGVTSYHPFYKTCHPTPKMMGKIISYPHNHVRCADRAHAEAVSKELEGLILYDEYSHFMNIRKNFYDENGSFKKPTGGYKNYIEYLREIDNSIVEEVENERNKTKPNKAILAPDTSSSEEKQHKKEKKVQWQLWDDATAAKLISKFDDKYINVDKNLTTKHEYLDATKVFLEKNLQLNVDQYIVDHSVEDQKIDVYSFAVTILHLLNECTYAINNQEETGDKKFDLEHEKFLPKYTVEHSIGAFCVHLFNNQQDIDEYYNTIIQLCLATDPDDNKDANEIQQNRNKFYGPIAPQSLETGPNDNKDASENQQNINTIIQLCLATDPDDNKDANEIQQNRNEFYGPIAPQSLEIGLNANKNASENQQNINTITTDSDDNKDIHAILTKMGNFKKLLETINENPNSPYKSATREHDKAYHIIKDDQGNVSFSNDTFMDCADIASRHIINLISYDKSDQEVLPNNNEDKKIKIQELSQKFVDKDVPVVDLLTPNMQEEEFDSMLDKFVDCSLDLSIDEKLAYLVNERLHPWHRIFGEEVLNSKKEIIRLITDNVNVIVPAIAGHTSIKDLSKKEWLLHFYMHQALDPKGADAVDTVTRTFWELVISHMDKDVPDGFFTIKYSKTNKVSGNELEPGFLNSLKLLYNLSYALKSDNPDLKFAETAINALENVCKNPKSDNKPNDETKVKAKTKEEILQDVLKATLGLFYSTNNMEFKVKSFYFKNDDCCAEVNVIKKITEKEKLSFSIMQNTGHAKVTFEPIVFNKLDDDLKKFVETEPSLQPFAYKFREKLGLKINVYDENYKKSVKPIYWTVFDLRQPRPWPVGILFDIKKIVPPEIRKTQFFQNYETLRFLRTMQGEARNIERIRQELTPGCAEANIKINNKNKLLSTFIYENYASRFGSNSSFDFLNNWEMSRISYDSDKIKSFSEEAIEHARKAKIIAVDSNKIEYLYTRPTSDNKEVLIFPLKYLRLWIIPATVKINGETFKVVGTPERCIINVKNIIMSPKVEKFTFGSEFRATKAINFKNAQNLQSLTFGSHSFSKSLLKEVIVPNNVTELSIEPGAFYSCESLETFIFSDKVKHLSIGNNSSANNGAFRECKSLKQVKFPANLKTLDVGYCTFKDCISLQEVIIPSEVTAAFLGEGAFYGCKSLIKIEIPGTVTELSIGSNTFTNCDALKSVPIPNNVTKLSIPWGALLGYTLSEKVEIPTSVVSLTLLGEGWKTQKLLDDQYKGIIKIKIPEHVKDLTISEQAFSNCKALKKIIGPRNVNEEGLNEIKSAHIEYVNNDEININEDSEQANNNNTDEDVEEVDNSQQNKISDQTSNNDQNNNTNENTDGLSGGSSQAQDNEFNTSEAQHINNGEIPNVNNDSNHTRNREISNVNNEGYIARLKGWFGSAISNVWNGIKSIAKWLVFWR